MSHNSLATEVPFSTVTLTGSDRAKTHFRDKCYDLLRLVPAGKVTTYKEIAHQLGSRAYRAVGQAMHHNPYAPEVPCHRVVCSDGSLGGYAYGLEKKILLLKQEGIEVTDGKVQNFASAFHNFS